MVAGGSINRGSRSFRGLRVRVARPANSPGGPRIPKKPPRQRRRALLLRRPIGARDEERRRSAHDLHDGLGRELAAAKLMLETLLVEPHQGQLEEKIAQTKQSIGRAITVLSPVEAATLA
jgi:signal transduction histidine kinase